MTHTTRAWASHGRRWSAFSTRRDAYRVAFCRSNLTTFEGNRHRIA